MYKHFLDQIKTESLYRIIKDRESCQGRLITINGVNLLNFSSNDYLGLASNKEIFDNAVKLSRGLGSSGASRLLSGGCSLHQRLEDDIAKFKGCDRALLFNSGYAANLGVIPALAPKGAAIFSDELNHASIIDGCRLSHAERYIYRHSDPEHLEFCLKQTQAGIKVVITESVFSMDGDIAPIDSIHDLSRDYNALLYIDDAHGLGVISKPDISGNVLWMGTLSKSLGSYGGYAASSSDIIDYLINTSRSLIYSTALPAFNIAVSICALEYMLSHPELRNTLIENIKFLRSGLIEAGIDVTQSPTPIIPLLLNSSEDALRLSKYLMEGHIYVPAIRPPTVKKPRLRISVSACHTIGDLTLLINNIVSAIHELHLGF